jgi:hypothetical protein
MKIESKLTQKIDSDPNHPLHAPSRFKYLPLAIVSLLILILFATCQNSKTSQMGARHQPYIYVQNPDGTTVKAEPVKPLYRSDAVIANFTVNWLKLAYTWKVPPDKGKAYVSERGTDFPASFHTMSMALEPEYREVYMDSIAQKYQKEFPFSNYISGQTQSYVRTFQEPKIDRVKEGVWDVTIVATRTHASEDSIFAHEIFNHVIRVRAIKLSTEEDELWGDRDTHLGKLFREMEYQGLQIVKISQF